MFLSYWIFSLFIGISFANTIHPLSSEKHVFRGENVILSCNYSGDVNNLQWFRQDPGSRPEHLILVTEYSEPDLSRRLSAKAAKDKKQVNLTISSAEVSDSALYYCALQTGSGVTKIIFGQGTTLRVESKDKKKADVYKLEDNSCLATDYTDHKEVNFTNLTPVRYSGEKYQNFYSIFALNAEQGCNVTDGCKGGSSGQIDMEFDEKINFMSLGLFWLRILLLKTVVFNILMTFKAWMS